MNIKRPSGTQIIWDGACPIGGPTPKTRWRLLAQSPWNGITRHLTNHIDSLHWASCPTSPCSAIQPVMRQPQALYGHLVKTRQIINRYIRTRYQIRLSLQSERTWLFHIQTYIARSWLRRPRLVSSMGEVQPQRNKVDCQIWVLSGAQVSKVVRMRQ